MALTAHHPIRHPSSFNQDFAILLRQESLGREEEPRTRKPFVGTLRVANPAWQSWASSQKRVLRSGGQLPLRSVDSQVKGRVIEPRKHQTSGAFVVRICGGRAGRVNPWSRTARSVLPGSESTGNDHQGSPGTWETPLSPPRFPAREPEDQLPGAPGRASSVDGSKVTTHTVVSPSEGNEARREGRWGVGASHTIGEAGEPFRGTPWRKGDAVS
jgi:hypothetical protein